MGIVLLIVCEGTAVRTLRVEVGEERALSRLFDAYSRSRPEFGPEVWRRQAAMREFGRAVMDGRRTLGLLDPVSKAPETGIRGVARGAAWVPRNAPCPCGSGKKYKNCCGR